MTPTLSLITGTLNRPDSYRRLLHSIRSHTPMPWEVVVSDASDDPIYAESSENIVVIPERPRLTCVQGFNNAFKRAKGKWIIWLNDDAEVQPGYADMAIEFMEAHPSIGLGCLHYAEDDLPFHINSAWGIPYANFGIISRAIGDEVGWFDTDLRMYGNDNSLTFRVLLAGYGIADIPGSRIIHHSVKDRQREENQAYRYQDNQTLQHKYLPQLRSMTNTYNRHKIDTSTEAWSHGKRPQLVRVP